MRRWILATVVALCPLVAMAQTEPVVPSPPPPPPPPAPAPAPSKPPMRDRVFFGGGVGLSFGTVDYVEVSPLVGFRVHPKVDVGLSLTYRWRNDSRYDISTSDYGGTLFGRYRVVRSFFLEADWEYLDWEYIRSDLSKDRTSTSSFLAGGGYYLPLGGRASMAFSALYNFSYDKNDPFEPYGDPWVVRIGVGVGF